MDLSQAVRTEKRAYAVPFQLMARELAHFDVGGPYYADLHPTDSAMRVELRDQRHGKTYLFLEDGDAPTSYIDRMTPNWLRPEHIMGVRISSDHFGNGNLAIYVHRQEYVHLADVVLRRFDELATAYSNANGSEPRLNLINTQHIEGNQRIQEYEEKSENEKEERDEDDLPVNKVVLPLVPQSTACDKQHGSGRPRMRDANPDEYYRRLCLAQRARSVRQLYSDLTWKEVAKKIGWQDWSEAGIKRLSRAIKDLAKLDPTEEAELERRCPQDDDVMDKKARTTT